MQLPWFFRVVKLGSKLVNDEWLIGLIDRWLIGYKPPLNHQLTSKLVKKLVNDG